MGDYIFSFGIDAKKVKSANFNENLGPLSITTQKIVLHL